MLLFYDPFDAFVDWDVLQPFFCKWGEVIINHVVSDPIRAIDEWQEAFNKLPARISFAMYIYLCSNANGFPLALSPADFMKQLNVSKSSYDRAVDDLLAAGYLMMRNEKKNTMDFYTSPQPTTYVKKESKKKNVTGGGAAGAASVSIEEAACEPPADEEPSYGTYSSLSPYRWEES